MSQHKQYKNPIAKDFLPTTRAEMDKLGWRQCDVILVSGDAYIDSPFIGVATVGRMLEKLGYKVGMIGQPDLKSDKDIKRLGEPRLYWGISGGSIDSMVSNYTATKKFRNKDDYTPGGINNKRPDRAVLAYCNLIRQHFKDTVPLVLGGIEASLRRVTHYDYWSNKLRKPILFDSKADILIYGMGEEAIRELTKAIDKKEEWRDIRGLCYIAKEPKENFHTMPSHKECLDDKEKYIDLFDLFREIPGIRKAFVSSGVRYDLITEDKGHGYSYLKEMVKHHISGQMKVAPEHTEQHVLDLMGKPNKQTLVDFKKLYDKLNKDMGKKQYMTYYLIAAHPGCTEKNMHALKRFTTNTLKINPEQAQVFIPTPGTYSAVIYYTELDPITRKKVFVEKDIKRKEKQKAIVQAEIKKGFKSGFAS